MSFHRSRSERISGVLLLLLTVAGWASSPLFLKYFVSHIDAWSSNGWRYGISALFWLPVLFVDRAVRQPGSRIWRDAIWPAVFNSAGQVMFAWVLYLHVDPGLMTFLLRVQIVAVTAGAMLLFADERPLLAHPGYWLGLSCVVGGTVGAIFLGDRPPGGASLWGVLSGIGSGLLFGCYAVAVRARMARYRAMTSFAAISLYTAAASIVLMLLLGESRGACVIERLNAAQWGMLILSSLAGIALGHVFYYASIARLGVMVASGVLLLQPFVTAIFSYFIYDERLTLPQWLSGGLSITGAGIVLWVQDLLHRSRAVTPVLVESDSSTTLA